MSYNDAQPTMPQGRRIWRVLKFARHVVCRNSATDQVVLKHRRHQSGRRAEAVIREKEVRAEAAESQSRELGVGFVYDSSTKLRRKAVRQRRGQSWQQDARCQQKQYDNTHAFVSLFRVMSAQLAIMFSSSIARMIFHR